MGAQAYKHRETGPVIAVASDSYLAKVVTDSRAYDPASLDDLPHDVPAYGADAGGTLGREEHGGGWVTAPGVRPEAVTAGSFIRTQPDGSTVPANTNGAALGPLDGQGEAQRDDQGSRVVLDPALLAAAYDVDTVEGVNGYLDEHPEVAGAVLAYEADNKNRTGIVAGRHAAPATPPAGDQ